MSALRKPSPAPSPVEIFNLRCEARAILVEACLFDLQEAVDGLAFADVPRAGQLEADIRAIADCLETMPRTRPGAAPSTLQAAEYLIQQKDPARLKAWLAKHSRAERIAINKHISGAKR